MMKSIVTMTVLLNCVTNENIYQNDESGVVYKYNSASIGGIIVACGTLAVSINTIITQEKASQHKFWDPSDGTYITPGYNPGSITFFVILAILALIILVVSIKKLRTKCKYHKCPYCQKTTVIPCDAQSCDCDVCGQKILITNGKPERFHYKRKGVKFMKKSLVALTVILLTMEAGVGNVLDKTASQKYQDSLKNMELSIKNTFRFE